jgi:Transposase-associated domain
MEGNRNWMYNPNRMTTEFLLGVKNFLNYAYGNPTNIIEGDCIKCPCKICGNTRFYKRDTIEEHLIVRGFREYYHTWYMHGEIPTNIDNTVSSSDFLEGFEASDGSNPFEQMVRDAVGPDFDWDMEEAPNPNAELFYKMLKDADEPLWDGCDKQCTRLSCVSELLAIKSDCNLTKESFNRILSVIQKWLPKDNRLPLDYYRCKKVVKGLDLGYQKIDVCPNHCMLYYGINNSKKTCDNCGHSRFKEGRICQGKTSTT